MMTWLASDDQYLAANIPTGFGKSLLAMLLSHFSGRRTIYLTSTKGLQGQLISEFNRLGLIDIRGQNEYQCIQFPGTQVDRAPCKTGYVCPVRSECSYYSRLQSAQSAQIVVTNYAYWLSQLEYGGGLNQTATLAGHPDIQVAMNPPELLILDEAHMAGRALESFLSVQFDEYDRALLDWSHGWDYDRWRSETHRIIPDLEQEMATLRNRGQDGMDRSGELVRRFQHVQSMHIRAKRLSLAMHWIQQEDDDRVTWTPLWTKDYSHMLFRQIPKVMMMSAILTPKMVDNLGVKARWLEAPSPFPAENTPITHVKTVRVNHRATDEQMRMWAARVDDILSQRQDRKGIVFTVSYARAKYLREWSRYAHQMYTHHTRNVSEVVARFKEARAPAVLVSPSVTTGYDFPGEECEYVVVGKVPYPDTRAAIIKARVEEDRDWAGMLAMEVLVQETGRGTRSADDKCQVMVIDDSWHWWWPRYKHFAPKWFQDRVTSSVDHIPKPI
jgi:ATP-dependent DNA helicase DinG